MKRTAAVILVIVLMALSSTAWAGVGFKGGLNFTKWTGDDWGDTDEFNWKMGFKLGAFATFPLSPIMTVQPEVYFATNGWEADVTLMDMGGGVLGEGTISTTMNYLEIPVLLKLNMDTGMNFAPSIFAGPYLGYLLGDPTMKIEFEGEEEEEDWPEDTFKSIDIGGVVGASFDYNIGMTTVTLEARYNMGFVSIVDVEDVDVKNMGFSLMGGFSF